MMETPTFVILAVRLLTIRQQTLLKQLFSLLRQPEKKNSMKKSKFLILRFCKFLQLNQELNNLCSDIHSTAIFWSTPLTVFFCGFITMQSYVAYIVFFEPRLHPLNRAYFIGILFTLGLFLYLPIGVCSRLAAGNSAIERASSRFYCRYFSVGSSVQKQWQQKRAYLVRWLAKAEVLTARNRLRPYCMYLLDGYRITSRFFYMVMLFLFNY